MCEHAMVFQRMHRQQVTARHFTIAWDHYQMTRVELPVCTACMRATQCCVLAGWTFNPLPAEGVAAGSSCTPLGSEQLGEASSSSLSDPTSGADRCRGRSGSDGEAVAQAEAERDEPDEGADAQPNAADNR